MNTMVNYVFDELVNSNMTANEYDNAGAYAELQQAMKRGDVLSVRFYTNKDNLPCAWIESRNVQGFCYILKEASLMGLFSYVFSGAVSDFDENPNTTDDLIEGHDNFQLDLLKMFVNAGKSVQFVPLFRENPGFISAVVPMKKGKLYFRVERTDTLLDYLREKKMVA